MCDITSSTNGLFTPDLGRLLFSIATAERDAADGQPALRHHQRCRGDGRGAARSDRREREGEQDPRRAYLCPADRSPCPSWWLGGVADVVAPTPSATCFAAAPSAGRGPEGGAVCGGGRGLVPPERRVVSGGSSDPSRLLSYSLSSSLPSFESLIFTPLSSSPSFVFIAKLC